MLYVILVLLPSFTIIWVVFHMSIFSVPHHSTSPEKKEKHNSPMILHATVIQQLPSGNLT